MKLIDDNFEDYFEKGAPKKENAPHEETEEEREERELIETTIERRSNKKRLFLALGTLLVLLLLIFFIRDRYFHVYQESDIKGRIADVSLRGSVFKTYEGKMLSYDVVAPGNVVKSEFNFSVKDDSIVQKLGQLKQTPLAVQVHYKEYKSSVPWRGETKYIVTAIDTVTIDTYIDNVKDIPLPTSPQTPTEPEKKE
jgi:hypothetical protein